MTRSWPGERASSSSSGPRARGPRRFRLAAAPRLAQWFSGGRARPGRQRPRRLPHAALASPWLRRDELPLRAAGKGRLAGWTEAGALQTQHHPGERCLWGSRCRRRYRHRHRRRVLSLWREGGGGARAQRHKYISKGYFYETNLQSSITFDASHLDSLCCHYASSNCRS